MPAAGPTAHPKTLEALIVKQRKTVEDGAWNYPTIQQILKLSKRCGSVKGPTRPHLSAPAPRKKPDRPEERKGGKGGGKAQGGSEAQERAHAASFEEPLAGRAEDELDVRVGEVDPLDGALHEVAHSLGFAVTRRAAVEALGG